MEVYFLGTGAGSPSRERNVTAIALKLFEERGVFWLFDCGEGTQHQILRTSLKLSKLEKIFITHLHGDHIYGLPGLLTSRSQQGATMALTLYGPSGIRKFIDTCLAVSQATLAYDLTIVEYEEGIVFADEQFSVDCALLEHRIASFGFRIVEHDKPGRLKAELLQDIGVRPGPIYAQIKQGIDVQLDDGRKLNAKDFVAEPQPGRIVVIMGDTRICEASMRLAKQADLLVHEATFARELEQLAHDYYHTTSEQAAKLANESGVYKLVLTHFSSRYQVKDVEQLLCEAKAIHPCTFIANDFDSFSVVQKDLSKHDGIH